MTDPAITAALSSPEPYHIRELIREHIAAAESVHVRELSEGIAGSVPSGELRDALRECLPHLVREVLNSTRPPVVVPAPAPAYSAKIARRREMAEAWRRQLDAFYSVGDGEQKRLGEFSHDELVALADELQRQAMSNLAREKRLRALADEMQAAGCDRLADLPESVLSVQLGVAA